MLARIHALNNTDSSEDSDSEDSDNELTLTKEAEEELALKEYNRALNLLAAGKTDVSIRLMKDLLECDIIVKTVKPQIPDTVDRPILRVKYCLHRNLAASADKQDNYKDALHHYCLACDLDGSDCFVWYKLGQVAMKSNRFDIALHAFDQGLDCNPNHWPSMDCLIRLLYAMGHLENCLYYIQIALKKEPRYIKGHFMKNLIFSERPFLKKYYANLEFPEINCKEELTYKEVMTDLDNLRDRCSSESLDQTCDDDKLGIYDVPQDFITEEILSWSTIGNLLIKIYSQLKQKKMLLCFVNFSTLLENLNLVKTEVINKEDISMNHINYALESIVQQNIEALKQQSETVLAVDNDDNLINDPKVCEMMIDDNANSEKTDDTQICIDKDRESKENSASDTNNDDKDNSKDDGKINAKDFLNSKPDANQQLGNKLMKKRRGSELAMLDYWGKSKQRRSSRKKNYEGVMKQCDSDETIEDALKRIIPASLLPPDGLKIWKSRRLVCDAHSEDSMNTMDLYELFDDGNIENSQKGKPEEYQVKTSGEEDINTFKKIEETEVKNFIEYCSKEFQNISELLREWLIRLSQVSLVKWPKNLNEIFVKIYLHYREIHAEHPWIFSQDIDLLREDVKITMTFVEFYFDTQFAQGTNNTQSSRDSSDKLFLEDLNFLDLLGGRDDIFIDEFFEYSVRFLWLKSQYLYIQKQSKEAIEGLKYIEKCIETHGNEHFIINLANCEANSVISLNSANVLLKKWERKESLLSLRELYQEKNYDKIAEVLMDYLVCDNSLLYYEESEEGEDAIPRPMLLHLLIESLWVMEKYKDVLNCSILCLHECCQQYFTGNFGLISETWAKSIQSMICYIEATMNLEEPYAALMCLSDNILTKLVRCLCNIIVHQLCDRSMKIYQNFYRINLITPWILLYYITGFHESRGRDENMKRKRSCSGYSKWIVKQRLSQAQKDEFKNLHEVEEEYEDDDGALLSTPIQLLFAAHDYLGKRKLCTASNGLLLSFILNELAYRVKFNRPRVELQENLEQCCYCLYGHPPKKPRYVTEHDVAPIDLNWNDVSKIYEVYRPDKLPEFDSRITAINSDTEILFQRLIQLMPMLNEVQAKVTSMNKYIFGSEKQMPLNHINMPHEMVNIFYLLGDFYMKNRDMPKAIKHYTMDVCIEPLRLDSWAGMALALASQIETKLYSCEKIRSENKFLDKAFATARCFEHTLEIDPNHCVLLIEFGSFAYLIHSYWSRLLKQASETLSMERFSMLENRKENMLEQAYRCFTEVRKVCCETGSDIDERWLHHYMLGKIAEKLKKDPVEYLNHYWEASRLLEENNACYPRKINYTTPQHLAVEALEVFYRLHASILKYLEHHSNTNISRDLGELFMKHLINASKGPFGNLELVNAVTMEENEEQKEIANKRKLDTVLEADEIECSQSKIQKTNDVLDLKSPTQTVDLSEPESPKIIFPNIDNKVVTSTPMPDKSRTEEDGVIIISDSDDDEQTEACEHKCKEQSDQNNLNDENNRVVKVNTADKDKPSKPIDPQERLNDLMKECLEKMEFSEEPDTETESRRLSQSSSNAKQSSDSSSSSSDNEDNSSDNSNDSNNSSSSDDSSSSSESSSSSDSEDETSKASSKASKLSKSSKKSSTNSSTRKKSEFLTKSEIDKLITLCIASLEECINRCPQHYKAFYRLGYHFLKHGVTKKQLADHQACSPNSPPLSGSMLCKQLLMTVYNEGKENVIQGLFSERKPNNFFNGIWRLPASDIDRAGSFASHMSRCVTLLMEVLMETGDHRTLLELCLQLQKIPDADKKYLRDQEREELAQQALTLCVQTLRNRLKKLSETKNQTDLITFILDVFRSYKKAKKHLQLKEKSFSALLTDAYKVYTNGKEIDSSHLLDVAIRFCQQQLSARKQSTHTLPITSQVVTGNAAIQQQSQQPALNNVTTSVSVKSITNPIPTTQNFPSSVSNAFTHVPKPRGRPPNNPIATYNIPGDQTQLSNMLLNQYMSMLNDFSKLPQAAAAQVLGKFPNPFSALNVLPNQTSTNIRPSQTRINNPSANSNSNTIHGLNTINPNQVGSGASSSPSKTPSMSTLPSSLSIKKLPTSNTLPSSATDIGMTPKQLNQGLNISPSKNMFNLGNYMTPGYNNMTSDFNNMFKNFFQNQHSTKKQQPSMVKVREKYKMQQSSNPQRPVMPVPQELSMKTVKKIRHPKLSTDFTKISSNISALPKTTSIKNKKECLPNTSAITCTVVSAKDKPVKTHPTITSLPSITITPVHKLTQSFQSKPPQETTTIRSHNPTASVQNTSTKSLQEKLAEKQKTSMETNIIRID